MSTIFKPIKAVSSSEQVASAIRQTIIEGTVAPGERLPPERTLAISFNVTRNTVREALRRLEQMRLVSVRQGAGVTIQDYLTTTGLEFISDIFGSAGEHKTELMMEIAQARTIIGNAMSNYAIDHFNSDSIDCLERVIEKFKREATSSSPDIQKLQHYDFEFHNCMIRGAGNRVLILLHNSIRHIYRQIAPLFEALLFEPDMLIQLYLEFLQALKANNREKAKEIMSDYFLLGETVLSTLQSKRSGKDSKK